MRRFVALLLVTLLIGCGEESTPPPVRTIPTITAPISGTTSGRLKVTVQGTAEPDRAVDLLIDSGVSVRVYTSDAGTFEARDIPLGGQGGRVIWARMAHDTSLVSAPVVITMNYASLESPVLLFPVHGCAIPAGSVPVAGRAPAGVSEVEVYRDGARLTSVAVEDGGFFLPAFDPSGTGLIELWTRGVTASGTHTAFGESIAVTVGGGESPILQFITTPVADTITGALDVAVHGQCTGSEVLALLVDGGDTGLRAVPAVGAFSFPPTALLEEGPHVVGIVSMRASGTVAEGALRIWVDRAAPRPPVLVRPAAGEISRVPAVTVEGATEPGALVGLTVDGIDIPHLVADGTGMFSCGLDLPGDGTYGLVAWAEDVAGNRSSSSPERSIVVDSAAPTPPTLDAPAAGTLVVGPTLSVAGSSQAGSWLEILIDGNVAEGFTTGASFQTTLSTPTPDGAHAISVRGASVPGAGWVRGDSVRISVDLTPPPAPVILQPADSTTLATSIVHLAGAAESRATVTVVVDDQDSTQAQADGAGAWALTLAAPEADEPLTVRATATDTAGHASAPGVPHVLFFDRTPPDLSVTDPVPDQLFSANPVTVEGSAEPGATVTVDGASTQLTAGAFAAVISLNEGPDTVVVTATDGPGNRTTILLPLHLDTTLPVITITSPSESLITQSSSVTMVGTTEVGSTVTIQGSPVSVDDAGGFTGVVTLAQGWTTIAVVSTDKVGWTNRAERHVVRDAVPTAPGALHPDGGVLVTTGKPALRMTGATDPNGDALFHTMEVYADALMSQRLAQSPPLQAVGGTVSWTVVPDLPLSGGTRYWKARAFDGLLWGPWSAVATFRLPDVGPRNPHRVLGYGDSITAGAQQQNGGWIFCEGYREELELALTAFFGDAIVDTTWIPGGMSASGVAEMQGRLADRPEAYLLILFGTIDAGDDTASIQMAKNNIAAVAAYARSLGMIAIIGTVPPRLDAANARVQQLNALLRPLADGNGILVADHHSRLVEVAAGTLSKVVCEDGVHPSDLGYSVMAETWYYAITASDAYPLSEARRRAVYASSALR